MRSLFRRKPGRGIGARITEADGRVCVDVRGQTCPGYLLSINRAVESLAAGMPVTILTTYAPCGADVEAWCRSRGHVYESLHRDEDGWSLRVTT